MMYKKRGDVLRDGTSTAVACRATDLQPSLVLRVRGSKEGHSKPKGWLRQGSMHASCLLRGLLTAVPLQHVVHVLHGCRASSARARRSRRRRVIMMV